ncbi:MAG: hypothetical protein QM582_07135 [Micropruina sp.]|uniref:hypothetical protein n=1 Tax=Micropruina sp. TaxID=2737536 RepID=UPI0039E24D62
MIHLDTEHLRVLHAYALAETGGAEGVRDEALLEAAAAAPYAGFGGTEFHPTIEAKAARLAFGIIATDQIQSWIEAHEISAD